MPAPYRNMEERLMANSVQTPGPLETPCWIWIGRRAGQGKNQGAINVRIKRGPNKGKVRSKAVHRVSYETFKGVRLKRHSITRHLCHNLLCINPGHMIGNSTSKANNNDTVKSGRHRNQHTKEKS